MSLFQCYILPPFAKRERVSNVVRTMPLLLSRSHKTHDAMPSSSRLTPPARQHTSSSEMRARYEMAQAMQKPWPVHLIENGTKSTSSHHTSSHSAADPPRSSQQSSRSHPPSKKRQASPSRSISSAFGWKRRGSKDSAKSNSDSTTPSSSPTASPKHL